METSPTLAIIDGLRKNRETFAAFCRSLSDEELSRLVPPDNKWTVKDFIIHNLTFDDLTAEWLARSAAGDSSVPPGPDGAPFDIDEWNNRRVEERRHLSVDELFEQSVPQRTAFEEVIAGMTAEQLAAVYHFTGDNKRDPADVPIGLFLHGLVRHDPIHTVDMLKALPERADDPELKEWVDDRMVNWYQRAMAGPAKR